MAYHAGCEVNSSVSAWCFRVDEDSESANLLKVKLLVPLPRTGNGRVSVTNMRFVRIGKAFSSPSLTLPACAITW